MTNSILYILSEDRRFYKKSDAMIQFTDRPLVNESYVDIKSKKLYHIKVIIHDGMQLHIGLSEITGVAENSICELIVSPL